MSGLTLFCSCARKVTLNADFKKRLDRQHVSYRKLQYFNRHLFELKHQESYEAMVALNGTLRDKRDRHKEVIRVRKNTRAVCDSSAGDTLYVRFEKGPGRLLAFAPAASGGYELVTRQEPSGDYFVRYAGQDYLLDTHGHSIGLKAKRKKVHVRNKDKRRLKGVHLES